MLSYTSTDLQVFYHVAAMGDWRDVVAEQFDLLKDCELNRKTILTTFVGATADLAWLLMEARNRSLDLKVLRADENILHYETFAMIEIEHWAKTAGTAIALYFHTKGVSAPGHEGKIRWRRLMQDELVRKWREHLLALETYDTIGVNWRGHPLPPHFCGNFWMATAAYLRTLPDFVTYHNANNLERTNCEFWIGSRPVPGRILSLVHSDTDYCSSSFFG